MSATLQVVHRLSPCDESDANRGRTEDQGGPVAWGTSRTCLTSHDLIRLGAAPPAQRRGGGGLSASAGAVEKAAESRSGHQHRHARARAARDRDRDERPALEASIRSDLSSGATPRRGDERTRISLARSECAGTRGSIGGRSCSFTGCKLRDPHRLLSNDGGETRLRGEKILIATGSSPVATAGVPVREERVHDGRDFELTRTGASRLGVGVTERVAGTFAEVGVEHLVDGRDTLCISDARARVRWRRVGQRGAPHFNGKSAAPRAMRRA